MAPHARQLGVQSTQSDQQEQRRADEDDVDARHGPGQRPGGDAADLQRRHVSPESERSGAGLDARTGDLLAVPAEAAGGSRQVLPVFAINRNMAIYGDKIIDTSADDYVFALDAKTGALAWETKILDYQKGAQQTSGPIIANGKIISGRGCEPEGGPGCLRDHGARCDYRQGDLAHAHDSQAWRAGIRHVGRRSEEKRIHVGMDGAELRPAVEHGLHRHVGDITRAEIHARRQRQALPVPQLDAGAERRHREDRGLPAPGRSLGLDHPFERLLLETAVPNAREVAWINPRIKPGEKRRVITGIPGKTGIVYTLDRQTGSSWARPTVQQNVIRSIDGATGAVTGNPDVLFSAKGEEKLICPSVNGGKNCPPVRTARKRTRCTTRCRTCA